ncbi:hypothetical protein TSMEX_007961 [Taenia solium]|eukprot:TsM_000201800 transcript=TsM_000201800 gene=TsM_000201800
MVTRPHPHLSESSYSATSACSLPDWRSSRLPFTLTSDTDQTWKICWSVSSLSASSRANAVRRTFPFSTTLLNLCN